MSSALDILVQVGRLVGGVRRLVNIVEVTGMEGDVICLHDIFRFNQTGIDDDGNAQGHFEACGVRPRLLDKLKANGVDIPNDMFHQRILTGPPPSDEKEQEPHKKGIMERLKIR
jgi:pilus assembly protein CpaF